MAPNCEEERAGSAEKMHADFVDYDPQYISASLGAVWSALC